MTRSTSAEIEQYLKRSAERRKRKLEREAAIKTVAAELREQIFQEELAEREAGRS